MDDLVNIEVSKEDIHTKNESEQSLDKVRMMRKNESVQYILPTDEPFIETKSFDKSP